ncbi:chromosome segregation protein smc [Diplodia corticola]|uniref:Chromosome segregation protein smc n=1 Tax=Diplodia corticola TaxID=236234 RepID=A0A1J9S632_9PEZI|nr:chromosome segregation protein smc [Diplodia corticola]OJD35412.1 chromosome segregation protein smc [Diplodia corticola]
MAPTHPPHHGSIPSKPKSNTMDVPLSPNPARNPWLKPGQGKYDKDFLLSLQCVFTRPPAELVDNLRHAGVTRPLATPPRRVVPSIGVTPPAEDEREKTTPSEAAKQIRKDSIAFVRKRTDVRLNTKEAEVQHQQQDLDRQKAELDQQKRALDEERVQLHNHCTNLQNRLEERFQQLHVEAEQVERARLENTAQTLMDKAQLEKDRKVCNDLHIEAWMSKAKSEQTKKNTLATARRVLAFFQVRDDLSGELSQRALAMLEAEVRALEEQDQDHNFSSGAQHGCGSQNELQSLLTGNLAVPRDDLNRLVLITGIPLGIAKDEVARAVGAVSGGTIRVYSVLPGSPTMMALAYIVGYPNNFFAGNFYVMKDGEIQPVGKVRLHFRLLNL